MRFGKGTWMYHDNRKILNCVNTKFVHNLLWRNSLTMTVSRKELAEYSVENKKGAHKIKHSISMFHRAFFNSIIDKHQHKHFSTFKTVLV